MRRSKRLSARAPAVVPEPVPPPHSINLLELPTEMLLAVLEWLLRVDPVVLLGAVPGVCRRIRALCEGVRGEFDLRGEWERLDGRNSRGAKGALAAAARLFPRTRGLWTFSKLPLHGACRAGQGWRRRGGGWWRRVGARWTRPRCSVLPWRQTRGGSL